MSKKQVHVLARVKKDGRTKIIEKLVEWTGKGDINNITSEERKEWIKLFGGFEVVNKKGKVAKRIKNNLRRDHGLKLTGEQVSEIGNLAQNNSTAGGDFQFKLDDPMNMTRGRFGDDNSCFYGFHENHRLAMSADYENRFRVIKVYDASGDKPLARAFVFYASDGAQLVFNAYGTLDRVKIASIVATANELPPSRAVSFSSDIYINNNASAVGGDKTRKSYSVHIGCDDEYNCEVCGNSDDFCACTYCEHCEHRFDPDYGGFSTNNGEYYCEHCFENHFIYCEHCEEHHHGSDTHFYEVQGISCDEVCEYCFEDFHECEGCYEYWSDLEKVTGYDLCEACIEEETGNCAYCEQVYYPVEDYDSEREYCQDCQDAHNLVSEGDCPNCHTYQFNLAGKRYPCEPCERGTHHSDCPDCNGHPLAECAEHYAHRQRAINGLDIAGKALTFPLFCNDCWDFASEQVRHINERTSKAEAYCLPCYAKRFLNSSLSTVAENVDYLKRTTGRTIAALEYLEVVDNEGAAMAFDYAYSDYVDSMKKIDRFWYDGYGPSAENCADRREEQVASALRSIADLQLRIDLAMQNARERAQALQDASGTGFDVLATLKIDDTLVVGSQLMDQLGGVDYQDAMNGAISKLYALEVEREKLDDLLESRAAHHLASEYRHESLEDWQLERGAEEHADDCWYCDAPCDCSTHIANNGEREFLASIASKRNRPDRVRLFQNLRHGLTSNMGLHDRVNATRDILNNSDGTGENFCADCPLTTHDDCHVCDHGAFIVLASSLAVADESLPRSLPMAVDRMTGHCSHCGSPHCNDQAHFCALCEGFCPSATDMTGYCGQCGEFMANYRGIAQALTNAHRDQRTVASEYRRQARRAIGAAFEFSNNIPETENNWLTIAVAERRERQARRREARDRQDLRDSMTGQAQYLIAFFNEQRAKKAEEEEAARMTQEAVTGQWWWQEAQEQVPA